MGVMGERPAILGIAAAVFNGSTSEDVGSDCGSVGLHKEPTPCPS